MTCILLLIQTALMEDENVTYIFKCYIYIFNLFVPTPGKPCEADCFDGG
jgi:hypothetical protein